MTSILAALTDLGQARDFLRDTLGYVALAAAPHADPELVDDLGPVRLASMFEGEPTTLACSVTVRAVDRFIAADPNAAIMRAAENLATHGWSVQLESDGGNHRVLAERDGYEIAGYSFDNRDSLTLTGQTPARPIDPEPEPEY